MRVALLTPLGEGQLGTSLAPGLEQEGHDVVLVRARRLTSYNRLFERTPLHLPLGGALARTATRTAAAARPDAVVVVRGRWLHARAVERLREATGAPVVNLQTDNPLAGRVREPRLLEALPAYDLVTAWSEPLAAGLEEAGARRVTVLPFAYDPELYAPEPREEPRHDVVFVSSASAERVEHVRALEGLDIALSGARWRRMTRGTPLASSVLPGSHWGRAAAGLYRAARVGINVLDPQNLIGHNMRTWELPATGTPMVATRTPDHERLFGDRGALLFESPAEMRAAVDRLLADAAERDAVGAAGLAAVREGTYRARARELVSAIESVSSDRSRAVPASPPDPDRRR